MKHKSKKTWIVVMDSAAANFYLLPGNDAGRSLDVAAKSMQAGLHRHASDLKSDKPGRGFPSAGSSARHGMEPPHDYHKLEKHEFVHAVCGFLEHAFDEHEFDRLVIVAPERSLGELRSELPDKVKRVLWREVPKDLMKLGVQDLWTRLAPLLEESAPPAGT